MLFAEGVAEAVVAGACVAGAVAAAVLEALDFVGLALFVAVAGTAAATDEDDDEADALDVAPIPVTGPPAIFIALVVPN
jgi:hypothetical protein